MTKNITQILIVDDNKDLTGILRDYFKLFENKGIKIIGIANDGREAIEMISIMQPDIVILDILMPVLSGIGVLESINDSELNKKPLFIVLSVEGQERIIHSALNLNVSFYIEKPFDMDVLISKILELKLSIDSGILQHSN